MTDPRAGAETSRAPIDLYERRASRRTRAAAAFVVVAIAAVGATLFLRGEAQKVDPAGDFVHVPGEVTARAASEMIAASMADLAAGEVVREGSMMRFEATMHAPIPRSLRYASLEVRWRIRDEADVWNVAAVVEREPVASIVAEGGSYGASTEDGTLPGDIQIDGSMLTISLDADRVERFPTSFEWELSTRLSTDRRAASAERVEDRLAEKGSI